MADIKALADSALRKLRNGDAIYRIDAARKAINGSGVFDKSDVKRLKNKVLVEMRLRENTHVQAH